jgi:ADP-dependent NAD(P)H-hydrate dehydratase
MAIQETGLESVTRLPLLPPRPPDSHKGNFGRILVVAGSRGMSGAAVLCGSAALRSGAGLVTVAVPQEILPIVASGNPCYLTSPLSHDEQGKLNSQAEPEILALAETNQVVALGPGLGTSEAISQMVMSLLVQVSAPLVLDADGLNTLIHKTVILRGRKSPLILTPHPGEFARLVGMETPQVQANRQELAVRFSRDHGGVILILKGQGTIVTDGRRLYTNTTGNPGMATGGTGDVLTGVIAALLGQNLEAFAAAQLGVYLHGLAGDLARNDLGEVSLIATDLLQYLSGAFQKTTGKTNTGAQIPNNP